MNHLLRSLAPITDSGWELLDEEAKQRLGAALAARKLVDFAGPRGWEHSATNLGRATAVAKAPGEGVTALQRRVLPLVELRADFTVSLAELRDHDRGALDVDLDDLDRAAHRIAVVENIAVFHGWAGAIAGIAGASQIGDFTHTVDPTGLQGAAFGYTGIVVAALARYNPFAVCLVAVLLGGLENAGFTLQGLDFPSGLVGVIQGIILFCAVGGELLIRYRLRTGRRVEVPVETSPEPAA